MDNQTTFLNEFNVTAPELSKDVNVIVAPGSGSSTLIEKTITENGTYYASQDDADGYSSVEVNVEDSDMHTYSTTEQIVGTWIDGKPLYEITYSGNFRGETEITDIDVSSLNAETWVKIQGITSVTNAYGIKYAQPLTYAYAGPDSSSPSELMTIWYRGTSNEKVIRMCYSYDTVTANFKYYVVLQYTKTTDTANT